MELTKKTAKALSVKKWEYIVGNNGSDCSLELKHPELEPLHEECGYCEKYINIRSHLKRCIKCPIRGKDYNIGLGCMLNNHPFSIWQRNKTKANAQAVLDLIKKS